MVRTIAVFSKSGLAKEKEGRNELTRSSESVRQPLSIVSGGGFAQSKSDVLALQSPGGCDIYAQKAGIALSYQV